MALPSVADAAVVVILLLPGFLTIKLFSRITALDQKLSEFDITVYSLGSSFAIYIPFALLTGLDNFDKVRDAILLPTTLSILLFLSAVIGTIPAIIIKKAFREQFEPGNVWNGIVNDLPSNLKPPYSVIVYADDDREFIGFLRTMGTGDQPQDLLLEHPELVLRNDSHTITHRMKLGDALFLPEKDIKGVAFLPRSNV